MCCIWFVKRLIWPGEIEFIAAASLAIAVIFHPGLGIGQSLEPRVYSNTPVGMNFLILGYAYQQGDVLLAPSVPLKDVMLRSNLLSWPMYARSTCGVNPERSIFLFPTPGFRRAESWEERAQQEGLGFCRSGRTLFSKPLRGPRPLFRGVQELPTRHHLRSKSAGNHAPWPV